MAAAPPLRRATAWGSQTTAMAGGAQPSTSTGQDSRDRTIVNDWATAHQSPSYYAQALAIPGYSNYAGYKSFTNFNKNKAAWTEFKNQRARGQLRGMAGEEGLAYGYKPAAQVRKNGEMWAAAKQGAQEARNEGRVNMAYGYLPAMRNSNPYSIALNNNALITGEIGHTAGLARDAAAESNTANAEVGAREAAMNAAQMGTVGSSMNRSAKQNVLGSFLAGRGATAAAAQGSRLAAAQGLEQERLGAIQAVRGRGAINLGQRVADISGIRQLGQAQQQVVPGAIGGAISGLGDTYANNALYATYARGQAGGSNGGGGMPSLSGGSNPSGGFFSRGTR